MSPSGSSHQTPGRPGNGLAIDPDADVNDGNDHVDHHNGHGSGHGGGGHGHGGNHHGGHGHGGKPSHHHHGHVWCGKCKCAHKPGHHTVSFSFSFGSYDPWYWPVYDRYDLYYDEILAPVVYVPEPAPVVISPPPIPTLDDAWYALKGGLLEESNAIFAEIITLSPDSAMAYVGHALTSTLLGDGVTGIRDMRLAIVLEPEVLRFLPLDEALVLVLEDVRAIFVEAVQTDPADTHALFMVASLHYALAEDHKAYFTIRRAIDRGDFRESSRLLHDVIDASLASELGLIRDN